MSYKEIIKFTDRSIFSYYQQSSSLILLLPPHFIVKILLPYLTKNTKNMLKLLSQFIKENFRKGQHGSIAENILIYLLFGSDQNFSLKLKYSDKQDRSYEFKQIQNYFYGFRPINTKENYFFINSFIPSLTKMYEQMNSKSMQSITSLFLPVISSEVRNIQNNIVNQMRQLELIDPNSRCIDIILVKITKSPVKKSIKQLTNVSIWAFDMSTSLKSEEGKKKLKDFLEEYLKFGDRNRQSLKIIQIDKKNEVLLDLNYFVIGPEKGSDQILQFVKNKFTDKIKFSSQGNFNSLQIIEVEGSKKSLLSQIGYLQMKQDLKFEPEISERVLYLDKIYKSILEKHQKTLNARKQSQMIFNSSSKGIKTDIKN